MPTETQPSDLDLVVKKWQNKPGSLIMMLHEIQNTRGYVPREAALELAEKINIPLARIYEVLTFYNYFKLSSPGRAVISICTGTACHLKGADELTHAFAEELDIAVGQTSEDGNFHLQTVRCVGCCGLAPVVVVNGKTYGKVTVGQVKTIVEEWRRQLAEEG